MMTVIKLSDIGSYLTRARHRDSNSTQYHYNTMDVMRAAETIREVIELRSNFIDKVAEKTRVWMNIERAFTKHANWWVLRFWDKEIQQSPIKRFLKDYHKNNVEALAHKNTTIEQFRKISGGDVLIDAYIRRKLIDLNVEMRTKRGLSLKKDAWGYEPLLHFPDYTILAGDVDVSKFHVREVADVLTSTDYHLKTLLTRLDKAPGDISLGNYDHDCIMAAKLIRYLFNREEFLEIFL